MHVWLNGAFGVGKTTTAERMKGVSPSWRVFNPESVGEMFRASLHEQPFTDFQELVA